MAQCGAQPNGGSSAAVTTSAQARLHLASCWRVMKEKLFNLFLFVMDGTSSTRSGGIAVNALTTSSPETQAQCDFPGFLSFSHSRRALLMRVCHPRPVALKASSTSASRRMLTCAFVAAAFGRPRGFSISAATSVPSNSGSTSAAGRARWKSSSVHSGFSLSTSSGLGLRFIPNTTTRVCLRGWRHVCSGVPSETAGKMMVNHVFDHGKVNLKRRRMSHGHNSKSDRNKQAFVAFAL